MEKIEATIQPAAYWVSCSHCTEALTRGDMGMNKEDEIRFEEDELVTLNGEEWNCNVCGEWNKIIFNA